MADSRHNKYVSVTDWFKPAPGSTASGTVSGSTGVATSGASFVGGSWGSGGSGGGGQTITIIKTNDTTPESNSNVYSALRVHNSFIAKDKDERTEGKLSSDVGFEVGEYVSGSSGAIMYVNPETLQTTAELDRLYVRIKAYFETLEIINVNSIGGKQIISPAGSIKCTNVAEHGGTIDIQKERQAVDEYGNPLYDVDGNPIMETYIESVDNGVPEDTYRCYFLSEQDGEKVENRFKVGDQAYCQMFNAKPGVSNKVSNKYYWRLVTGIGDDYVDLSISDCDTASDPPAIGDVICHRGSRTDIDRQNALEFSAVDSFSPSVTLYQGIGSGDYPYSLVGKDIITYGVNQLNNRAFMNVYGDMYVGDRDGKSYLQFDNVSGLTVRGNVQFGAQSKMDGDDMTLEERIQQAAKAYEEDVNQFKAAVEQSFLEVQDQIDGAIETYFLDPIPTLDNEPAIDWKTNEIKNAHIGDLYYSGEGKAYRFQYTNEQGYYWNLITDTDITLALANAAKAQDTADKKRTIFTKQPSTNDEYQEGDMWANATYPTTGTPKYSNDLLRAITSKTAGQPFSIDHWVLASKYTDDTAANAAQAAAEAAQTAANNAQTDATNAANRLTSWAADNVISPTEKQGIKEEYVRVIKDKDNVHAQWDEYFLDTTDQTDIGKVYIAYNAAYLPYVEQLIYLFTAKDDKGNALENIPIPDDFDDNQSAYYEKRTAALNTIAVAAKDVADKAQAAATLAQEAAAKAIESAEQAKESVYSLNGTVTGLKDFTDEAFLDGIINGSERTTIENYIYQIDTVLAQVQQSYTEVVDNEFLVNSTAKTQLENSYNAFITATNELIAQINIISKQGSVENIDRAAFEVKYNNFNSKYSDYTKYLNAAIKFIEYAINSRVDETVEALGGYSYLKGALGDGAKTTITKGLVLTSLIALGSEDKDKNFNILAGISGTSDNPDNIALWAGGPNKDVTLATAQEIANNDYAQFLVRMDGTGYAAGGNFWWESDGTIHADPLSFVISEQSVGALLSSLKIHYDVNNGKPKPYAIEPLVPFTTLTVASDINLNSSSRIAFGDKYISYDSAKGYWYLDGNLVVTGGISMYSGVDINVPSIFDNIPIDNDTIYWEITSEGKVLKAAGGGGGGVADSVAWANITGKPNFAAVATSGSYSDLIGKPTLLSSFTNDLGFITSSALSDYLPLSGGMLSGALTISSSLSKPSTKMMMGSGYDSNTGDYVWIDLNVDGSLKSNIVLTRNYLAFKGSPIWHAGNFNPSDYLPKSGGRIDGASYIPLQINSTDSSIIRSAISFTHNGQNAAQIGWDGHSGWGTFLFNYSSNGVLGITDIGTPYFGTQGGNLNTLIHGGNYSDYALPLTGGTISGNLYIGDSNNTDWMPICFRRNGVVTFIGQGPESLDVGFNDGYLTVGPDKLKYIKSSYQQYDIIHSGNIGSQSVSYASSAGSADMLSKTWYEDINYSNNPAVKIISNPTNTPGVYPRGFVSGLSVMSDYVGWQMVSYGGVIQQLYFRSYQDNGTWHPWKQIAFTDSDITGNASSASKLQTARTIWGQSFDGSSDISGNLSGVWNLYVSSEIILYQNGTNYLTSIITSGNAFKIQPRIEGTGYNVNTLLNPSGGNVGIGNSNPAYKLDVSGSIYASSDIFSYYSFIPNAGREGCTFHGTGISWHNSTNSWTHDLFTYSSATDMLTMHRVLGCLSSIFMNQGGNGIYLYNTGISWHNAANAYQSSLINFDSNSVTLYQPTHITNSFSVTGETTLSNKFTLTKSLSGVSAGVIIDADILDGVRRSYITLDATSPLGMGMDYIYIASYADGRSYFDIPHGGTLFIANTIHANNGGNVGVGTTSPSAKLHVAGTIRAENHISINSSDWCEFSVTRTGKGTSSIGGVDDNGVYFAHVKDSTTTYMYLKAGTGLTVHSNILTTGSVTMNSMRSMKNIINENGLSLEELSTIKPTRFTWKDGRDDRLHIGGIADDVMNILPEVVFKGSDGVLSMDYASAAFAIGASLIKPVSEHELKIKELECKVQELENELKLLKSA